jgi:hypothetical protein
MKRKIGLSLIVLVLGVLTAVPAFARGNVPHGQEVVYVMSQGKFFDTIVLGELPQEGRFQKLEMKGPSGLQTEYGPGDVGYLGGRWWVDVNMDGIQNEGDKFFLCPLLGPGRETQ